MNPPMIYIWCYALCRAYTTLNHTDAKSFGSVSACAVFGIGVVFEGLLTPILLYVVIPNRIFLLKLREQMFGLFCHTHQSYP